MIQYVLSSPRRRAKSSFSLLWVRPQLLDVAWSRLESIPFPRSRLAGSLYSMLGHCLGKLLNHQ